MVFTVLINGKSGSVAQYGPEPLAQGLRDALGPALKDLHIIDPVDFLDRIRNFDGKTDLLVGGGDGTIRTAAALLKARNIPFGVIPLGTMNLFAHDLSLPPDPIQAAMLYRDFSTHRIDTGVVNGELFLCNAMVGMPSDLAKEREKHRNRENLQKWFFLIREGFRKITGDHWLPMTMVYNGKSRYRRIKAVVVANNEYEDQGTGVVTFRKKSLSDGALSVYAVKPENAVEAIAMLSQLALGSWHNANGIERFNTRSVKIHMHKYKTSVLLDGEIYRLRSPLRFSNDPASLSVLVPKQDGNT